MGSALAHRLLTAGCDLAVYNRTTAKAEPLVARGASIASRPADLSGANIVFVTVGGSDDLIAVLLGPEGLIEASSAPKIVVDCSPRSPPRSSQQVRERLAERERALLAAPRSWATPSRRPDRARWRCPGPRETFEQARPYLDLLGAGATYVGEGDRRIVKLCHNLLLGVVTQSLAEVAVLASSAGSTRAYILECLNNSVMGSTFSRYKTPALVNLDFHPTFTASLLRKDFDLGLAAAREREVPLPVAATVHQLVQSLVGRGYGGEDFAALLLMEAESAGVALVSENVEVSDGLEPDQAGRAAGGPQPDVGGSA